MSEGAAALRAATSYAIVVAVALVVGAALFTLLLPKKAVRHGEV
ncbi:hypothetical protein ACFFV7_25990 [Nonomuraea spiralis]|uniref:Uncharacterized protein n=1 Tax=Nonomuraea spiralis TaxID=46182 RepID=A0ABV5IKS9_9ACTN|nr:hypothetical protein [Nonomuraea spiralis]GGT42151.1 hypothetical protein GCM10010176_102170 [Nonomuraea spiralis]